jgi:acyl-CoA thioesterase-2
MPDLWTDLLACLAIAAVDDAGSFEGRNQRLEYHRVFGGQLLAQFIRIASLTCPDKAVKSQHALFAREGRADEPIRYDATRNHKGRSFATLTITARQSRGVVATSSISMHASEGGPEHQETESVPAVLGPEHEVSLDVTSHTVWFHRPFRTDSWLLLRQHSPLLAHGRCFGRGDVLTEDGTLVASYGQETLLRFAN